MPEFGPIILMESERLTSVFRLSKFRQSDIAYKNTTTLFVTSDLGHHFDTIVQGFAGHSDNCVR
jgi:hypothetical protein